MREKCIQAKLAFDDQVAAWGQIPHLASEPTAQGLNREASADGLVHRGNTGEVERSQKTDREEFWATADLSSPDLELRVAEWQRYYNWDRPHGSLNGQTPIEMLHTKSEKTPFWDDVEAKYDPGRERFQVAHYQTDLALRRHGQAQHQAGIK